MKFFSKLIFAIGILYSVGTGVSFAEQITVTAEVDKSQVALGSAARLILTVGGTQNVNPVQLPSLDGFEAQYLGPTRSVQIENGKVFTSIVFNYSLFPQKVGHFTIPSLELTIDGQKYTTESIPIEVVDAGGQEAAPGQPPDTVRLQDRVFLKLEVPKTEVYVNEPLPVKVMLFVSAVGVTDVQYPKLEKVGFAMSEFAQPKQYQQVINGRRFDIVEFDTVIYPTRTGQITLGEAKLDCNLVVQDSQRQTAPGGFDGFFNDQFFDKFFNNYQKRPYTVTSEPFTLNVLALPEEGKPNDFKGAVGNFQFEASASPAKVKEGDPITLRMKVQGEGNLSAVEFPKLAENDQIRLYDPNIKEEQNSKVLEQVVIPKTKDLHEIPALSFSYFDPNLKKYQTITQGPFPIEVEEVSGSESPKVVGLTQVTPTASKPEKFGQDIVFIKEDAGTLQKIGPPVYRQWSYIVFVIVVFVLWFGLYIYYKQTRRMETDTVYAKAFLAPRQAKSGLLKAQGLLTAKKKEEFYDTLFKTFQQYLSNKFHLPIGNVTYEEIKIKIVGAFKDESINKEIQAVFNEADMIRYASGKIYDQQMAESYQRVERVIDYLERYWR